VKRQVPLKSLQPGEIQPAAKGTVRQTVKIIQGIPDEKAKQISKFVRGTIPKAQTQIQGSQLRVSAKSKDDLQKAIQAVKAEDFGLALQFTNYR
jgi:cyclic-di-GMP-binding protein